MKDLATSGVEEANKFFNTFNNSVANIGNASLVCPAITSRGSDDVAVDICNSFISSSANQTDFT